jgi:tetratricopeptide (TPR) repeat protein
VADDIGHFASENAAMALLKAGNHRGAEQRLRAMLGENPANARAMALLAQCKDEAGGRDRKEVLKLAREAAALDPDDHLVRATLSWALLNYGKGKAAKKEAAEITESIAAEDPEDSTALMNLGYAWLRSEKEFAVAHMSAKLMFDDAEKHASTVIELLNIGYLRLHEWNYASAASLAQRAMSMDPLQPDAFRILSECELALKRPQEAYDLALEALRLAPGEKKTMRLLVRAGARSSPLLRPFQQGIDWIVEMNRSGLVVMPLLMAVIGFALWVSVNYDLDRLAYGMTPLIIVSVGLAGLLLYALVCYLTAIGARWRIRRDLRKIALPDF